MTIKVIYKVEGDSNQYNSEQEALIAECLAESEHYFSAAEKQNIAEAISERYRLIPILDTNINPVPTQAELDQRELDSSGPSA